MRDAAEEIDKERALKEVAEAMVKDKDKATEDAEERARVTERAQALVEKKLMEMEVKMGGTELKLPEAESINLALTNQFFELKVTLEACKDKWYNAGSTNAENSVELIIYQSQ